MRLLKLQHYFSLSIILMMGLLGLSGCTSDNVQTKLQTTEASPRATSNPAQSKEITKPIFLQIKRSSQQMRIVDFHGTEIRQVPIGIGRGGLKEKQDMMDLVTPTGELVIDLILYQNSNFNRVNSRLREQYLQSEFREFFTGKEGLKKLFKNMNELDFNGDSQPDKSYGVAYIGLNSAPNHSIVTRPKMRYADWHGVPKTPYWFSIALHGTPKENRDIGAANSGGCIHVQQEILKELIEKGMVEIGTRVIISDAKD